MGNQRELDGESVIDVLRLLFISGSGFHGGSLEVLEFRRSGLCTRVLLKGTISSTNEERSPVGGHTNKGKVYPRQR